MALKKRLGRIRRQRQWRREIDGLLAQYEISKSALPTAATRQGIRRLIVLPSDPWTLVGAKGDEAMMHAVVSRLRALGNDFTVGVITATPEAEQAAQLMGFTPIPAWSDSLVDVAKRIKEFDTDAMVVLGADVLDGYYNPVTTARMLLTANIAAQLGAKVSILGFSFNAKPNPLIHSIFEMMHASVSINVRDQVSYDRFVQFCKTPANLVADSAFMLEPAEVNDDLMPVKSWAEGRRQAGELIFGFNMHPMLIKDATAEQIEQLIGSATVALSSFLRMTSSSILLISHDYRGRDGDDICLGPLSERLERGFSGRVMYPRGKFSAAQLKSIAGLTDGVVTGRMHLAIAALGMAKPVAALTYQDKFQGLFTHFQLPASYLLAPADAIDPKKLQSMLVNFHADQQHLKNCVEQRIDHVSGISQLNLAVFDR